MYNKCHYRIEAYNTKRPHMSCNYLTPVQAHEVKGQLEKKWKNSRLGKFWPNPPFLGRKNLAKKYHNNQQINHHEKNQASTSTVNKTRNNIVLFQKMTTKIS